MSKASSAVVDVQLIASGRVRVIGKPHPLRMETIETEVDANLTLSEILKGVRPEFVRVRVGGMNIPGDLWGVVRAKAGQTVEVVAVLHGAPREAQYLNARDYETAHKAATTVHTAGTFALTLIPYVGPLLAAIAGPVGALLINEWIKLAPIKKPPEPKKFYGIDGMKNETRPYGAVLTVLGQVRIVPPLLSETRTTWFGRQSSWTYMLADLGVGNLSVSTANMLIGTTPLLAYGSAVRALVGTSPSWGIGDVSSDSPNASLPYDVPGGGTATSVTQEGTTRIICEVLFNQTFFIQDNLANPPITRGHTDFRLRYRDVSGGSPGPWLNAFDLTLVTPTPDPQPGEVCVFGVPQGATSSVRTFFGGEKTFNMQGSNSPSEPIALTFVFSPPTRSQYEVRVERYTQSQTNFVEPGAAFWTDCISIDTTKLPCTLNTTKVSILIKANQDLNTEVETFSALVGQIIPTWNGSAWVDAVSSNPAFIFRWLLTACPNTLKHVSVERIDDSTIKQWAAFCDAKGFVFNEAVETSGSLFDLLSRVCSAGRASFAVVDGLYSVVVDDERTTPVQMFTPRNSSEFLATRMFPADLHGLSCRFPNENAAYQTDIRVVYATGYSVDGAGGTTVADPKKLADLDLPGVTSPDAVWRLAKYHLACATTRQNQYEFKTGIENLVCQRGDRIAVAHDVTEWGLGWGRVARAQNLFMGFSTDLSSTTTPFVGGAVAAPANRTKGVKFSVGVPCTLVGFRIELNTAAVYEFALWGASSVAIHAENINVSDGVQTVWFNRPLQLDATEYCLTVYHGSITTLQDTGNNSHAVSRQSGPLFIPTDAGVYVTGNANPIAQSGRAKGYRIEPIIVADISAIPSANTPTGAGVVQAIELDEQPELLRGASSYQLKIRNAVDPLVNSVTMNAVPENLARAISTFSRASPTGSYFDDAGALRYTNINNTQRETFDAFGGYAGLMVERAATNYALNSDDVSKWVNGNVVVETNQKVWSNTIGSSDKVSATDNNATHRVTATAPGLSAAQNVGASVFLHAGTSDRAFVGFTDKAGVTAGIKVNLSTGTVTDTGSFSGRCLVENCGLGWWRVGICTESGTGGTTPGLVVGVLDANGNDTFAGAGENIYVVGSMVEVGRGITSYLPAGGVTNTRAAEAATLNVPTKFGRRAGAHVYEGSIVFEADCNFWNDDATQDVLLTMGDFSTGWVGLFAQNGLWHYGSTFGETASLSMNTPTTLSGRTRFVMTWKVNPEDDAQALLTLFVNGVSSGSAVLSAAGYTFQSANFLTGLGSTLPGGGVSYTIRHLQVLDYALDDADALSFSTLTTNINTVPQAKAFWTGGTAFTSGNAAVGDLAMVGRTGQEIHDLMVTQINPENDMHATLTCCDYDASVYTADAGTPPVFQSTLSDVPLFANAQVEPPKWLPFFDVNVTTRNSTIRGDRTASTFTEGRLGIEPANNPAKISMLEVVIRCCRSDTYGVGTPPGGYPGVPALWAAVPSTYPGAVTTDGIAGILPDSQVPLYQLWQDDVSMKNPNLLAQYANDPPSYIDETGGIVFSQDVRYFVSQVAQVNRFTAPGVSGSTAVYALFVASARYHLRNGPPTAWTNMWAYGDVSAVTRTLFDSTINLPTRYNSSLTVPTVSATPTVNGISIQWDVQCSGFGIYEIVTTISRSPDNGTGTAPTGVYTILDTIVSREYGNANDVTVSSESFQYLDPVTDGAKYWYKLEATLSFNVLAPVIVDMFGAKAMQVTDGADVTGNAMQIRVKNPNFDEGDISWTKGLNFTIIPYP